MRGTRHRLRKESVNPPPSQFEHRQFTASRDSDASFASNRPSSIGPSRSAAADLISDRSYQQTAVRAINAFLSSHSSSISLRTPYPSAKDVTETLKFVLHCLDYTSTKLEEDLPVIIKTLNCPFKLSKSALRAPNTPSAWPTFLATIHWLVQIAVYNDSRSQDEKNSIYNYARESYLHYIHGDDDAVDALDQEFKEKLEQERNGMGENVRLLDAEVRELEAKVERLKSGPTEREVLEKEKSVLEEDVKKFHAIIAEFTSRIASTEKVLEEKDKELGAKVEENQRICEENEELRKSVECQTFNSRDVERMRRELQAVERDIGEAEIARNAWEEKSWDLDSTMGHKFKELEALSIECNQAIRRLKLGNSCQYVVNAKGSTPAEIMGIDYKSTLKPTLDSFSDEVKRSSMLKLEELISLQQQSSEYAAEIEGKKKRNFSLQSHIEELEAQLSLLRKETYDYTYRCAAEAKKMVEHVQTETQNMDIVEAEAAEVLTTSKLQLEEAIKRSEEEIQLQACELFALVDSISKYKESMESRISEMKSHLAETAVALSEVHKGSLPTQFGINLN